MCLGSYRPSAFGGLKRRRGWTPSCSPGPEVADRAERVGDDESAELRDPGRDLSPEARARDRKDLERRGDDPLHGDRVVRDAERRGHLGAVAGVAVEELDDAGRLAELRDPLERGRPQGGVEDPDLAAALSACELRPTFSFAIQPKPCSSSSQNSKLSGSGAAGIRLRTRSV